MDSPAVVTPADIVAGQLLIEALDASRVQVRSAFWYYTDEASEWRLALVVPSAGGTRDLYEAVQKTLRKNEIALPLSKVSIIGPESQLAQTVRGAIRTRSTDIKIPGTPVSTVSGVNVSDFHVSHVYRST